MYKFCCFTCGFESIKLWKSHREMFLIAYPRETSGKSSCGTFDRVGTSCHNIWVLPHPKSSCDSLISLFTSFLSRSQQPVPTESSTGVLLSTSASEGIGCRCCTGSTVLTNCGLQCLADCGFPSNAIATKLAPHSRQGSRSCFYSRDLALAGQHIRNKQLTKHFSTMRCRALALRAERNYVSKQAITTTTTTRMSRHCSPK